MDAIAGPSIETETGRNTRTKVHATNKGKKKVEEARPSFESLENINASLLPRNLNKQNELLESMRVMINTTVVEAVEASSVTVKEEINLLRTSFNNQIKTMSEKETRHHVESNLKVTDELEKITIKLTGLQELKSEVETSNKSIRTKIQQIEATQSQAITDTDERISTLEITEDTHFQSLHRKFNELETKMKINEEKINTMDERLSSYEERLKELEFAMGKAACNSNEIKERIRSMGTTPEDYAKINKEIELKRENLVDLSTRAENLMKNLKDGMVTKEEFEKIRKVGVENTNRLDRVQKEDKMLNLLFANLPSNLHNIQGFGNFAYNELNVELGPGDVMFISKVFESANRLVHLIRFRSLEVRNAVYRGRTNLGFRSRIWVNEDLIPSKEALALGARRRFRAGKIARNWTFQGEVYIALKNDPTPIKIMAESDFPDSTSLQEGEGMLPREIPLRNRGPQPYQGGNRGDIQRQRPSQDARNGNYMGPANQNRREENTGEQQIPNQNANPQQIVPSMSNQVGPNNGQHLNQTQTQQAANDQLSRNGNIQQGNQTYLGLRQW